jgi:hypothetical protein
MAAMMLGWLSEARTSASRWNRATRSPSRENSSGSLDRDLTLQLRIVRMINLAHAALSEQGRDLV